MAYGIVNRDGRNVEVCDECGFDGATVSATEAVNRLRELGRQWQPFLLADEELARARPAPATWCAVEYCVHTAFVIRGNDWQTRQFVAGESVDFASVRAAGGADPGPMTEHDCDGIVVTDALSELERASTALAGYAAELSEADLSRPGLFGGVIEADTLGVIRHVLHDAEHHLLDIRRGLAKLQLAKAAIVSGV